VFRAKYPLAAVKYCTNTWLLWKESLVACYINQRFHFGVIVTSPIEGCHANLKAYLKRGHSSLKEVFSKLKLFWTNQHQKIQTALVQQQNKPRHSTNIPLFSAILQQVHGYALQKLLAEYAKLPTRLVGASPTSCSCSIQQSIGLLYYYTIWRRQQSVTKVIYLEDIHPHWHFTRPEPSPTSTPDIPPPLPVLDPLVIQGRGRPRGALGGVARVAPTNTRREPSVFEIPSSSAPPTVNQPSAERVYIVNSGLTRLQNGHQDLYEAGTQGGRAYMRGLSSIWQADRLDIGAAATELMESEAIEVDEEVDEGVIELDWW